MGSQRRFSREKLIFVIVTCGLVYATTYFDCGSNYPPPTPGGGFYIEITINGTFYSNVGVNGSWQNDLSGAQGSLYTFGVTTDLVGDAYISGGRAPTN
jgi:hypothetical protein